MSGSCCERFRTWSTITACWGIPHHLLVETCEVLLARGCIPPVGSVRTWVDMGDETRRGPEDSIHVFTVMEPWHSVVPRTAWDTVLHSVSCGAILAHLSRL